MLNGSSFILSTSIDIYLFSLFFPFLFLFFIYLFYFIFSEVIYFRNYILIFKKFLINNKVEYILFCETQHFFKIRHGKEK